MYPKTLKVLIENLKKIPGVGDKTAQRYALWMMKQSEENVAALAKSLVEARMGRGYCPTCFHLSQNGAVCEICSNTRRDHSTICVVADPQDVIAIEGAREYRGVYHVLGGVVSPIDGIGPAELNILQLQQRVRQSEPKIKEVILAISPSVEGQTTSLYVDSLVSPLTTVTQIAFGIPMGGELIFADQMTLARAFEGRQPIGGNTNAAT